MKVPMFTVHEQEKANSMCNLDCERVVYGFSWSSGTYTESMHCSLYCGGGGNGGSGDSGDSDDCTQYCNLHCVMVVVVRNIHTYM